jgi:hypothetical protein
VQEAIDLGRRDAVLTTRGLDCRQLSTLDPAKDGLRLNLQGVRELLDLQGVLLPIGHVSTLPEARWLPP